MLVVAALTLFARRAGLVPEHSVYADPILPFVLGALSLAPLIASFASTKVATAGRSLTVGRVVQLEIASQVAGLISVLVWVSFDRSVWALVAGSLASSIARMLLSHFWLPGTFDRWRWERSAVTEIFGFGKWIFLSSILGFLVNNSDRLLLGGMIDASLLGIYSIAITIYGLLEQILTRVIGTAAFPALSEIARDRPTDLKAGYHKFHSVIAGAAYFMAGCLMMSGQGLIELLYDQRYVQAGRMLEILAVGLLATPMQISIQCFMALGLPQIHSRILFVRLTGLLLALPAGFYFFGMVGALAGIVFSQLVGLPIVSFYNRRYEIAAVRNELGIIAVLPLGLASGAGFDMLVRHLH
jgi:O-antigen/teichoic acid export membrane protein